MVRGAFVEVRADFEFVPRGKWPDSIQSGLVIRDRDTGGPSITNDAEAVVRFLIARGKLTPRMRLFYYDTDGQLDELLHDGTKFTGFAPGP